MLDSVNYIFILLGTLSILSILVLCLVKVDILHPVSLLTLIMTVSTFLATVKVDEWGLYIGFDTYLIYIAYIIIFIIGGLFVHTMIYQEQPLIGIDKSSAYSIKYKYLALFSILMIGMAYLNFQDIYALSLSVGNNQGYRGMIEAVRHGIESYTIQFPRWLSYRFLIAQMITYFYSYIFLYNSIIYKFEYKNLCLLVPTILFFPFIILSTGRMMLIFYVIFLVVVSSLLYLKKHQFKLSNKFRLLFVQLGFAVFFISLFLLLGFFTGKVNVDSSPMRILAHYGGLSIPAFDRFVTEVSVESNYIGDHTLYGIYRNFASLGFEVPTIETFLKFTDYYGITTNVYTALRRYIQDFGYIGTGIFMFIIGYIYTYIYESIKYKKWNSMKVILYAIFIYPLFLFSMDEKILMEIVNTNTVYIFFIAYILYLILLKGQVKK